MSINKIPCSCGHLEKQHIDLKAPIWDTVCMGKEKRSAIKKNIIYWCPCNNYQADNLKYLEQCYNKKGKKRK